MVGLCSVALSSLVRADERAPPAERKVPADAPPACVEPVGAEGPSPLLARGPKTLGTYTLSSGKSLDTPRLRLKVSGRFIPERLGSSRGELLTGISVALLPDVDRDGENPQNSVDETGLGPVRIGPYRVSVQPAPFKRGRPQTYRALVEEVGCPARAVHPPLAVGASKTFWLSTEAVATYAFSHGDWFDSMPEVYARLSAGLDPDVQQTPGEPPHGWINFQGWERMSGRPTSQDFYLDKMQGAVVELPEHRLEILKVVLGAETTRDEEWGNGRVVTKGKPPVVSALVRITRKPLSEPPPPVPSTAPLPPTEAAPRPGDHPPPVRNDARAVEPAGGKSRSGAKAGGKP
jgi:hypothetical protein